MRRLMVLMWLVGCSADDGDDEPPRPPEGNGGSDDECDPAALAAKCPRGWGARFEDGPGASESVEHVELADIGRPVCGDRGVFVTSEALRSATAEVAVTAADNTDCRVMCFPQCAFTNVCYAENPNGRACGHGCSPGGLTEDECAAFVAECLGEDPTVCEEAPR